jgi:phosphate starvation-inducible PhoH-like protein
MQNSTPNQMKMLLTRLGDGSKLIITGDMEQSDLGLENGLIDIVHRIQDKDLEYIDYVTMSEDDIIRHPAVSEVLTLY